MQKNFPPVILSVAKQSPAFLGLLRRLSFTGNDTFHPVILSEAKQKKTFREEILPEGLTNFIYLFTFVAFD
jgi:hypothetical protein